MKKHDASGTKTQGGARAVTVGVAVVAISAAAGLLLLEGGRAIGSLGGARLKAVTSDPLFVTCGLITLACAAGLAILCGAMWAAGASARNSRNSWHGHPAHASQGRPAPGFIGRTPKEEGTEEKEEAVHGQDAHATHGRDARATHGRDGHATEEGAATLEFALVLPVALMIVLIMIQSSLLMGGNLCTHYAAFCAARSAIVNVPRNFQEEGPNIVGDAASSSKLRRIQMAAIWAVMPVSCTQQDGPTVNASNLEDALAAVFDGQAGGVPGWIRKDIGRRLAYAQDHTTVTLEPPSGKAPPGGGNGIAPPAWGDPGATDPPSVAIGRPYYPSAMSGSNAYAPGEDLRIHVKHDFYLSVPYAARVFSKVVGDGMQLDFGQGQFALTIYADCTLTNEGEQDFVEMEKFPKDRHAN
jgi:hypothetical protein